MVYSTQYFGGSDPKTSYEGTTEPILVIYRFYNGSSSGSANVTNSQIRLGDWFDSKQDILDAIKFYRCGN